MNKINRSQNYPKESKKRPYKRIAVLAFAALLALSITIGAAAFGAFAPIVAKLSSFFGKTPSQIELIEQLGQPLGTTDSKNGITISADAMLSDGENFVILYTVSRDDGDPLIPADAEPGGTLHFGFVGGNQGTPEHPIGLTARMNNFICDEPGESTVYYLGYYTAPNGLPKEMTVQFGSLEYWYNHTSKALPLAAGRVDDDKAHGLSVWELCVPLSSETQAVKTVPSDRETFSLNGEEFVVTEIKISPISLSVGYEVISTKPSKHATVIAEEKSGDGKTELGEYRDDTSDFVENMVLTLRKKDGTEIDLSASTNDMGFTEPLGNVFTLWEEDQYVCLYGGTLPEIVPLDDVECIIFNGLKYPVN